MNDLKMIVDFVFDTLASLFNIINNNLLLSICVTIAFIHFGLNLGFKSDKSDKGGK